MALLIRLAILAAVAIWTATANADDWSYYQHDAAHTGDSSAFVNPSALSLAWSAPTGYAVPLIVGTSVYAMQILSNPVVSSFNLGNGATNWNYTVNSSLHSQAAVGGGFVTFVATDPDTSRTVLYVLDAITGTFRYNVTIPEGITPLMPTMVTNSVTGAVTAFVTDGQRVSAISLGATSGSITWTQNGSFGGQSIPTVAGSSIVLAGPGQYYAFDQSTGAANHFQAGGISGGGGSTVAYDAARQQFYVLEYYNGTTVTLSAYHYGGNNNITLLWQRTGAGVGGGGSVAIGPTGNVYSAGNSVIWELDPTTGVTLRSIPGAFASGVTPALTGGVLWIDGENQVFAYDLKTLQLLRAFNGSRGSNNTAYDSPGAFTDGYFLLDDLDRNGHSFDVYAGPVPEPNVPILLAVGGIALIIVRRRS